MGGPGTRYSKECKTEAVAQVIGRGYSVREVAKRIGVSEHSLYRWVKRARQQSDPSDNSADVAADTARLKLELKRAQEERDRPSRARSADRRAVLCEGVRARYAFVRDHRTEFRVATMCRVLGIHRSGFHAWLKNPLSPREQENERLVEQIRHFWNESDAAYGSPRIFLDLREVGETCGKTVWRSS